MTKKEFEERQERIDERKRLVKEAVDANINQSDIGLLNWAMNQLFRAARTIDLLHLKDEHPVSMGCDATAEVILTRLIQTPEGVELIRLTNPTLLRSIESYEKNPNQS